MHNIKMQVTVTVNVHSISIDHSIHAIFTVLYQEINKKIGTQSHVKK